MTWLKNYKQQTHNKRTANFREFVSVRTSSLLKTYKPLTRTVLKEYFDFEFVRVRISSLFIYLKKITMNSHQTLKSSHQFVVVRCFKNLKRINNELTTNSQRTHCLIWYIACTRWLFKHACVKLKSNLKEFVRVRISSLFINLEAFTTSQRTLFLVLYQAHIRSLLKITYSKR